MKLSVSVPDELWLAVNDPRTGASDTVQRGLRLLAEAHRESERPMANAPAGVDDDALRDAFKVAVDGAMRSAQQVLEHGYRFGLAVASAMTPSDFETIDQRTAVEHLKYAFLWLGRPYEGPEDCDFSFEFCQRLEELLTRAYDPSNPDEEGELVLRLVGDLEAPSPGVRWIDDPDGDDFLPSVSDPFAEAVLNAMKDVRDEALRNLRASHEERP
jgi:hypothetical protein